jgi:cytochrome c-type biogenesis protein CcmE
MKLRYKRLTFAAGALLAVSAIVALLLNAFQSNMVFFYSPTQVEANESPTGRTFRIGGLVQEGTVRREGLKVHFVVTDTAKTVPVRYEGMLPDLFQEGKGVVAQGQMQDGVFVAREVLAKHDENYMPPEAADAIQRARRGESRLDASVAPSGYSEKQP